MEEKDKNVIEKVSWTPQTTYNLNKTATWAIPFVVIGVLIAIIGLYELYKGIVEKDYRSALLTLGTSVVVGFFTYFLVLFIKETKVGIAQMNEEIIYSALKRLKYVLVLTVVILLYNMMLFVSMFI
ncbi:MAG: hypothetical protein LBE34_12175 [Flavobacteriaceae bacterium]|nr:hypothetical protein [Flavobacteriaceae bacterium]